MERRRKQAAELFQQGKTQADVARELEVSRQSVSRWYSDWRQGGATALRGAGRAGRLPALDQTDLRRIERRFAKGPLANGYPTDMVLRISAGSDRGEQVPVGLAGVEE